ERFDGAATFRPSREEQALYLVPSKDPAKLAAVRGLFARYAAEAVSFAALAKWLNGLGLRNSFGNPFQSRDVPEMLADPAYLGYPSSARGRCGRFLRYEGDPNDSAAGRLAAVPADERGRYAANAPADVVRSGRRLFAPLVDRPTWDAVQRKLAARGQGAARA